MGNQIIKELDIRNAFIMYLLDTKNVPIKSESADVVIANSVLEHIPNPRTSFIQELWRVIQKNGYLIINESPNKYIPLDFHTTGLFLVNWLPSQISYWYSVRRKKFDPKENWSTSGWKGIGYFEIVNGISGPYMYIPEHNLIPKRSRFRHRLLSWIGIPPCLLDPYPLLVFRKLE